jgi:uncharacterized protein (DUF305 family)
MKRPYLTVISDLRTAMLIAIGLCLGPGLQVAAQRADGSAPVIVQPGAPGQPTKTLPANTRAVLNPASPKDIEFMQGMIMHHAQAVEMVALMDGRVSSKELRLLGARISHSQADEIRFMERWLRARGQPTTMQMHDMSNMDMQHMNMGGMHMDMTAKPMLMPGMLTPEQMAALAKAKGPEFDRLFLSGMIQHHGGALTMVKELYDTPGAGQDAELSSFTTDIDSGQRAEIRIMQEMLDKNH